ncbi:MAG: SDR family NAD(P)-dependent oxidoreductase [Kofleriaceae bacterium]
MTLAVITGAARGIGLATSRYFAAQGWSVIGMDRSAPTDRDAFRDFLEVDVSDEPALATAFAAIAKHGPLEALVNNAAICPGSSLLETTAAELDEVMAINVKGAFFAIKHAHPLLVATRGVVVNVASVHAIATSPNIAAYAASKGALVAMTRALAVELAPVGIRVNAVLPGAVDTEMLRAGFARGHLDAGGVDAQLAQLASRTVLGRIGAPDEIAAAIHFLADTSRSSFMTGQMLVIDGGATARLSTE